MVKRRTQYTEVEVQPLNGMARREHGTPSHKWRVRAFPRGEGKHGHVKVRYFLIILLHEIIYSCCCCCGL